MSPLHRKPSQSDVLVPRAGTPLELVRVTRSYRELYSSEPGVPCSPSTLPSWT